MDEAPDVWYGAAERWQEQIEDSCHPLPKPTTFMTSTPSTRRLLDGVAMTSASSTRHTLIQQKKASRPIARKRGVVFDQLLPSSSTEPSFQKVYAVEIVYEGAPRHRRDVVAVTAWSMAWRFTEGPRNHGGFPHASWTRTQCRRLIETCETLCHDPHTLDGAFHKWKGRMLRATWNERPVHADVPGPHQCKNAFPSSHGGPPRVP